MGNLRNDEGVISMAITVTNNNLVIHFSERTLWIGLHKAEVEQLIKMLQEKLPQLTEEPKGGNLG